MDWIEWDRTKSKFYRTYSVALHKNSHKYMCNEIDNMSPTRHIHTEYRKYFCGWWNKIKWTANYYRHNIFSHHVHSTDEKKKYMYWRWKFFFRFSEKRWNKHTLIGTILILMHEISWNLSSIDTFTAKMMNEKGTAAAAAAAAYAIQFNQFATEIYL